MNVAKCPYCNTTGARHRLDCITIPATDAQEIVLGGLMLDESTWPVVSTIVVASNFYHRRHQLIFTAVADLASRSAPTDCVSVAEHLDAHDQLEASGGIQYLVRLCMETASTAFIHVYAQRVAELARVRTEIQREASRLIEYIGLHTTLLDLSALVAA